MFRQRHIYYILAFICFLIHFEPVWAQNVPLSTEYTRIYDFLDELSTDGVIRINHAVRPYTRKAIAEWLLEAQKSDSLLSKRQKSDLQFYLNEFALERDTVKNNFVQYTDHQTFNLSLADPQFSYISKNKQFKLSLRPILGMEIIGGKKGVILKRWWGAELTMDIAKHLSIWGSLRDISWNGTFGLSDAYYSDVYAKIDGAKLTKPGYLNNMLMNLGIIKKAVPWMEQQPFVWVALTAATVWWTIGYNMMLFVNSLNEIDPQLYEASSMDGAGFWVQLRYIILPSIKNIFFFVLMTTIIASFNVYGQPRLMTQGGPGDSTKPLIMSITSAIMDRNDLGIGSAMTILMGIIIVACSVGQYYLTREKEALR